MVRRDEFAVSDVLGSILLVGITVVMAAAFGAVLLAYDGPARLTRAEVASSVDPGSNGWGTGDETIRISHRGGDPLLAADTTVIYQIATVSTQLRGSAQLGSVFADGRLSIGETWQRAVTIQQGQQVRIAITSDGQNAAILLADANLVAAQTTSTQPCVSDTAAPTVAQIAQTPSILTALSSGSVTVTVTLADNCWGVNQGTLVKLRWQIGACSPTPTTTLANVVDASTAGINTWRGIVPGQTWSSLVGQCLHYQFTPIADLGGNSGATPVRSSQIYSDCSTDITAPTIQSVTQSPADVRSNTVGSVMVTVTLADDCSGVSQTNPPHLWYRVNSGSNPAYTDSNAAGMTQISTNTWQGTISGITWATVVGQTLEYYFASFQDVNGNVGTTVSTPRQDVIDLFATYTFPATSTATKGTISSFPNLQSATDSGAEATLAEAGTVGTPTTQSYNANGVISSNSWTSATSSRLGASDDLYASFNNNGPTTANDLQVALADPSVTSGTISQVLLSAELSVNGYANDGFKLQACLSGGSCSAYSGVGGQSSTDVTLAYDITNIKPGGIGTAWTWTDIVNLQGVVSLDQQGSRDGTWRVDRVWADVTFTQTTYSMTIRLDWTSVPVGGVSPTLELRYRTVGDTFNAQVCTWVAGSCTTFNTRGTTLNSPTLAIWTYALTPAEVSSGKVAVQFIDVATTGTSQGNLFLDYARVSTL